jgi:hypothetical protein
MKSNKVPLYLLFFILPLTVFFISCDGGFGVRGTVYELFDAKDSKGTIYIDEQIPTGMQLKPLSNITVRFDPKPRDAGNIDSSKDGKWFRPSPITDASGNFSGHWLYSPYKETILVTVEEDSYYSVAGEFFNYVDGGNNHSLTILLVRKNN